MTSNNPLIRRGTFFAAFALTVGLVACLDEDKDVAGVSVVENEIVGRILGADEAGVQGLKVRLFASDSSGKAIDSTATGADGSYRFASLKPGHYSILARQGNALLFDDAISVEQGRVQREARSLRPGGSVRTVVVLRPGDDVGTVNAVVLGTDFLSTPAADGDMGMDNMPEGTLRLRISTSLPGYLPLEAKLTIISGKETLVDTLHLPQAR
jgi:Carboxypeptidase regulatory-like domain